ncbi:iron-containing alcohol dehydrogenase [Shivajiella indica]|uniref:Iron-containing alcohol dehydrogenase n=1 Tax=Shivajiella indica TaxID=872115 RepID=A0ABW5BDR3_9BACT
MEQFTYRTHAVKVIFGKRILEAIQEELPEKVVNIAVLASSRNNFLVESITDLSGVGEVFHFNRITQHVPQSLIDEAFEFLKGKSVDILLCIGGGSSIGLGKGLALTSDAELWAVPTTYSGSEMTNIYGISKDGVKEVRRDDRVHPKKVFYDPFLSLSMPLDLSIPSAFNAMAHLVEALYAQESNPIVHQLSVMGIQTLTDGLTKLSETGKMDVTINEKLLFGAYLGGKVLCEVSMGLHHKAAHVLGGNFNLDHARVHTLLLPYVLAYQWDFLKDELKNEYSSIFNSELPFKMLRELQENLHVGFNLKELGMERKDLSKAVDYLMGMKYPNPAPMDRRKLLEMLDSAYGV